MSGIPFPQLGVFFVSREPIRNPAPLAQFAAVRAALEKALPGAKVPGSLSAPSQNRFAIATCAEGLGRAPESALSEVYEYDPVRYQAMVIGLVEPPFDTPVHWIARRVNPEAALVAVVPAPGRLSPGFKVEPRPRGYLGHPETLLSIGRLVKGKKAVAIEGTGLVVVARGAAELAASLKRATASAKPPRKPPAKPPSKRAPARPSKSQGKSRK